MEKLKYFGLCLMMFMSGFVANGNLIRLIPTNPDYEASWMKIFISLVLFSFFAFLSYQIKYSSNRRKRS